MTGVAKKNKLQTRHMEYPGQGKRGIMSQGEKRDYESRGYESRGIMTQGEGIMTLDKHKRAKSRI